MEQKHICASVCDRLPTVSANHPWLVDQKAERDNKDHIFYTISNPPSQHRYRIPLYLGRRIRGCFHGWVILSNHPRNDMWALWNPVSSNIIRLPRFSLKDGELGSDITQHCCLSSPPDDHGSVFMITTKTQGIVFCRLDCKRKRLKWVETSYAEQMRSIAGWNGFLRSLTCCDGKVYALIDVHQNLLIIHIDIVVKDGDVVIRLSQYLEAPFHYLNTCRTAVSFLKGCCTELFYILLDFNQTGHVNKETVGRVCVLKLDMASLTWEEMEDLKDAAFFLDLAYDYSVFYSPTVASELGGYVHIRDRCGPVIHSYDLKNKTLALSSMPASDKALLEHRLLGDHGEIKSQKVHDKVDGNKKIRIREDTESRLFNVPFDVLKIIMEFCVGVEYLNFRATCKRCYLEAPMIQWSKGSTLGRLRTYSLASPWLMVLDKERGVMSFTDPMSGDKYFIKTPRILIGDFEIQCSMCGWLLLRSRKGHLMFFNPFTSNIHELPNNSFFPHSCLANYCFSAPPTSSDCMVVGFTISQVYIHFVAEGASWHSARLNYYGPISHSFRFATLYRQNTYALYNNGGLDFIDINNEGYTWRKVLARGPRSSCGSSRQNFLMKCDHELLLVVVGEFGEPVEVFKLNDTTQWEKTESLGSHMIYICDSTCLCIEAEKPVMANKIYFPRLHTENGKIVFYSLETKKYHTFNGMNMGQSFGDFIGTKHHLDPHVWIEPSWA